MTAQSTSQDTTAPDRRASLARTVAWVGWPPLVLTVVALAILVWLGRDMTFYHDEFAFLLLRDLSPQGILAPHNEHLSATLVILYRTLVGTVGTVSYWPYLGVTFVLHVIVAAIVPDCGHWLPLDERGRTRLVIVVEMVVLIGIDPVPAP